jgi:hypothetical protein
MSVKMSVDRRGMLLGGAASVLASNYPLFAKAQAPQESHRPHAHQAPGQDATHPPDHTIRIATGRVELGPNTAIRLNSTMTSSPDHYCGLLKGSV